MPLSPLSNEEAARQAKAEQIRAIQIARIKEAQAKEQEAHKDNVDRSQIGGVESAMRGAAEGVSLGFSDEIAAGFRSLGDESFSEALEDERRKIRLAKEANPGTFMSGEIGGGIAGGALSFLVPGGQAATAASTARVGALLAKGAKVGGALGGLSGLGHADVGKPGQDTKELIQDVVIGAGAGAGFGMLGAGVGAYLRKGGKTSIDAVKGKFGGAAKRAQVDDAVESNLKKVMDDVIDEQEGIKRSYEASLNKAKVLRHSKNTSDIGAFQKFQSEFADEQMLAVEHMKASDDVIDRLTGKLRLEGNMASDKRVSNDMFSLANVIDRNRNKIVNSAVQRDLKPAGVLGKTLDEALLKPKARPFNDKADIMHQAIGKAAGIGDDFAKEAAEIARETGEGTLEALMGMHPAQRVTAQEVVKEYTSKISTLRIDKADALASKSANKMSKVAKIDRKIDEEKSAIVVKLRELTLGGMQENGVVTPGGLAKASETITEWLTKKIPLSKAVGKYVLPRAMGNLVGGPVGGAMAGKISDQLMKEPGILLKAIKLGGNAAAASPETLGRGAAASLPMTFPMIRTGK